MPTALQYRDSSASSAAPAWRRVAKADPYQWAPALMDAALERLAQARECLERNHLARRTRLLSCAVVLLEELRSSLDPGVSGDAHLEDLYAYLVRQLRSANAHNASGTLDEVFHLLREMRAAWFLLPPQPPAPRAAASAVK